MTTEPYRVKDAGLAGDGERQVRWADQHMPVLARIRKDFARDRPLEGTTLAACLHVTKETAVLMRTLAAGGATVALCGSNPLSTQDAVAAALAKEGTHVYASRGVDNKQYYADLDGALQWKPTITMDDGGDLVTRLHTERTALLGGVRGGTEETTTGVIRFRAMAEEGALKYPIVAVNDAMTKHLFDNRYGTGQSTLDGILRATSILLAGKRIVIAGYGWCGRGVANRARGMGANVIVTEVDPVRALEAVMDGFTVMPMDEATKVGEIFITVTGNKHVLDATRIEALADGAILANSGHFDNEIDVAWLRKHATSTEIVRPNVEAFTLRGGKIVYLLGEGRLVNLAAAEGHPPEVMDMSFANQALSAAWLVQHADSLEPKVYSVPDEIDRSVAAHKLTAMGVGVDRLTDVQAKYLKEWREGT